MCVTDPDTQQEQPLQIGQVHRLKGSVHAHSFQPQTPQAVPASSKYVALGTWLGACVKSRYAQQREEAQLTGNAQQAGQVDGCLHQFKRGKASKLPA